MDTRTFTSLVYLFYHELRPEPNLSGPRRRAPTKVSRFDSGENPDLESHSARGNFDFSLLYNFVDSKGLFVWGGGED
jgi:hypothetical protein